MTSTTFNMDCMDYMITLPDKFFDLAICDPPFFSGPEKHGYYGKSISTTKVHRVDYEKVSTWEIPTEAWYQEVCRVSKNQIIWGINYYDFHGVPSGRIVWDKCNDASTFSNCEIASCSLISTVRIFRYMWNGMLQGKSIEEWNVMQGDKKLKERRIHPTQKPIALYSWLLKKFANHGDRILDTHLGSGSSRIAAYELGYDFVGCEKDEVYFKKEEERFREYKSQMRLFTSEELNSLEDKDVQNE